MGSCGSLVEGICGGGTPAVRAVQNTEIASTAAADGVTFDPIKDLEFDPIRDKSAQGVVSGRAYFSAALGMNSAGSAATESL